MRCVRCNPQHTEKPSRLLVLVLMLLTASTAATTISSSLLFLAIQTDLGFADTAEFQALEAAAVRRPGEPPLHAVADQIHASSAGALGPGGIPVRADRRVDLSVHPPRVAGAAIGISSRFNPPAALSPQAEQLLKQKAARAAAITALLPADDRAVRRLPAVNEDLWNAQMHGNMDIGLPNSP